MLLFSVVIFVTLYPNLAFVHRNAISISNSTPNPPAPSSVFVKELSVNDNNMSKNNNANIRTAHPLPQATIKTHALALKTTTSQKQLPSKSNISNQRVSLPIGYNHNINNYTHALTKSPIQNTNNFSLSQQSSIGKSLSNGNSRTREELASVPISSNNNTSNIQINSHLADVPHHVVMPTKTTTTTTSKNNTSIVHKTIASTQIPNFNDDSTKIYYESSTVSTKSQLQQQQQEQKLKSTTQPNLDSLPLITANAGPDQKIKEGKKVTLHGTGSDSSSSNTDQLIFLWNQISGKSVKLHHIDTAKAKFKAPHVTKTTKLGFQLIVYDSSGNSSSDTVNIIVKSHKLSHSHKHRQ